MCSMIQHWFSQGAHSKDELWKVHYIRTARARCSLNTPLISHIIRLHTGSSVVETNMREGATRTWVQTFWFCTVYITVAQFLKFFTNRNKIFSFSARFLWSWIIAVFSHKHQNQMRIKKLQTGIWKSLWVQVENISQNKVYAVLLKTTLNYPLKPFSHCASLQQTAMYLFLNAFFECEVEETNMWLMCVWIKKSTCIVLSLLPHK